MTDVQRTGFWASGGGAKRWLLPVAFAVATVAAAVAVRWAADPWLPSGFPFLTFFPAVLLSTFVYGLAAGVFAGVLSTWSAWYFFMAAGPGLANGSTLAALGLFIGVITVDIIIIHVMQMAQVRLRRERERNARLAAENATLLQEAQHRISNNLQMLSSLLNLQRGRVGDEAARQALLEASNRLTLVGKIQRELYGRTDRDIALFLEELARDTVTASGADFVSLACSMEALQLPPEMVTPLGLVMLELLSNAIEHGAGSRPLNVAVRLATDEADVELTVADDGAGLPEGFDPARAGSLGLRIIAAMANQLGGSFTLTSGAGTVGRLRFPRPAVAAA